MIRALAWNQWQFEELYWWVELQTFTLSGVTTSKHQLDGAIRDNYPVSDCLGNLKDENSRWYLVSQRWQYSAELGQG